MWALGVSGFPYHVEVYSMTLRKAVEDDRTPKPSGYSGAFTILNDVGMPKVLECWSPLQLSPFRFRIFLECGNAD